jgi:hypothetical protein
MMITTAFKPRSYTNKGQAQPQKTTVSEQFGHIGHDHSQEKKPSSAKKSGTPWKLWLWGAADVTMMAGSVFVADMIVPEHHHHDDHEQQAVQTPVTPEEKAQEEKEEKEAWWRHALELSGIATGLHMLSHVGLAGGWYLYGRSRGKGKQEEELKDFKKVKHQLKMLEKDGANFVLVETAPGEFVLKAKAAPNQNALNQNAKPVSAPTPVETPKAPEPTA